MPSEEEISQAVHQILKTHDLQSITVRIVMNMLCEQFSLPKEHLNPQKPFVRDIISEFLANSYEPDTNEQDEPSPQNDDDDNEQEQDNGSAKKRKRPSTSNTPKKSSSNKVARPRSSNASNKEVKLTGLEKPVALAEPLVEFFGEKVLPRSQIPKRISAYAKQHSLQDPNDGRRIISDESLKKALNVDDFTFFSLPKLISGLVRKPEECDKEVQAIAKQCEAELIEEKRKKIAEREANGEDISSSKRPKKKQKNNGDDEDGKPKRASGLSKPMQLSDALIAVVGETQLPRSEVLKKLWNYIRENNLKDPNNAKQVICDDKLKAVFDGNNFVGNMAILKHISAHMTKIEET